MELSAGLSACPGLGRVSMLRGRAWVAGGGESLALSHKQEASGSCYRQDRGGNTHRGPPHHPCLRRSGSSLLLTVCSFAAPSLLRSFSSAAPRAMCLCSQGLVRFPLGGLQSTGVKGGVLTAHHLSLCDLGQSTSPLCASASSILKQGYGVARSGRTPRDSACKGCKTPSEPLINSSYHDCHYSLGTRKGT